MRGRFLDRNSRKQFHHPLPPATQAAAVAIIPRHQIARVTPPPPALLKGHVRHGPVRGLGQTSRQVVPGSRRVHQPAPCPQLYRGGTRRGWLDQQTQARPVARRGRLNRPRCMAPWNAPVFNRIAVQVRGLSRPPPETAAVRVPGHRLIHSASPRAALRGGVRRSRLPGEVTPFLLLASRRAPGAPPPPSKGRTIRHHPPVLPTGLSAFQVVVRHRRAWGAAPWKALRPAAWRGRLPEPTAPFLLREGRRCRGSRPQPYSGHVRRGLVPRLLQVALARIPRHRLARGPWLPAALLQGQVRQGPLFHTGLSAIALLLPCDVVPLRVEPDDPPCALRPELGSEPGQRVQEEDSCPARPPRCPDET